MVAECKQFIAGSGIPSDSDEETDENLSKGYTDSFLTGDNGEQKGFWEE
jgi:hypothetical protein